MRRIKLRVYLALGLQLLSGGDSFGSHLLYFIICSRIYFKNMPSVKEDPLKDSEKVRFRR